MPIVAGVDSSTQSCTIELRDADSGALLATGRRTHPPTTPPVSEQPAEAWWQAFQGALFDATRAAGIRADQIDAISVAAQCHGLVAMDASGALIRPVKLWNDTVSAPQAAELVERYGIDWWVRTVGSAPTAAFTISKLLWLAQNEPVNLRRVRHVCVPHDWLTFRLTGEHTTDRSDASGTAYFGVDGQWQYDLLAREIASEIDWEGALPRVCAPSEAAGIVRREIANELGLRANVIVGPGAGDQHAGALGLGLAPGDLLYSLGTSGVVLTVSDLPLADGEGWVNSVADCTGRFLPLVCTLNCTKVTDSFTRLLAVDHDQLAALALAAAVDRPRPVLCAYFDGERSPNRPLARGMLGRMDNETTREQLALAAFEGVLLGLLAGQRAIERCNAPTDGKVLVAGGGARSIAYRQLLADMLGKPVTQMDAPEATARGACIQAATVLHGLAVTAVRDAWLPTVLSTTEPRAGAFLSMESEYIALSSVTILDR